MGGIITYANAGSQFGYRMLIREQFPLPSGAAAMLLLFIANAGLTVSEFAGIGASMEIFGVSRYIAVPLALAGPDVTVSATTRWPSACSW